MLLVCHMFVMLKHAFLFQTVLFVCFLQPCLLHNRVCHVLFPVVDRFAYALALVMKSKRSKFAV